MRNIIPASTLLVLLSCSRSQTPSPPLSLSHTSSPLENFLRETLHTYEQNPRWKAYLGGSRYVSFQGLFGSQYVKTHTLVTVPVIAFANRKLQTATLTIDAQSCAVSLVHGDKTTYVLPQHFFAPGSQFSVGTHRAHLSVVDSYGVSFAGTHTFTVLPETDHSNLNK